MQASRAPHPRALPPPRGESSSHGWVLPCCVGPPCAADLLLSSCTLEPSVLNNSRGRSHESKHAQIHLAARRLMPAVQQCGIMKARGGCGVLWSTLVRQEVRWHGPYVTACDRQTWQTERQDCVLMGVLCLPRRMDWFKLQRFEKVFNASSTRIVTKKGVKWVTGGCTSHSALFNQACER